MSGSTIPTNLNLTSECYVSLKSLDEEYVLCTRWQPKETWSSCFCVPQAVQNIYSHCKSPANDLSQWYESYAGSVAQNQKDCAAAGRPNNATLIPPPNLMLTSACYSAMYAWNTAKKGCISASSGVRADELGKNRCICSITNLDEVERQCSSSAENSKNDWFPEYSDNLNVRSQACAAANMTVPTGVVTLTTTRLITTATATTTKSSGSVLMSLWPCFIPFLFL